MWYKWVIWKFMVKLHTQFFRETQPIYVFHWGFWWIVNTLQKLVVHCFLCWMVLFHNITYWKSWNRSHIANVMSLTLIMMENIFCKPLQMILYVRHRNHPQNWFRQYTDNVWVNNILAFTCYRKCFQNTYCSYLTYNQSFHEREHCSYKNNNLLYLHKI